MGIRAQTDCATTSRRPPPIPEHCNDSLDENRRSSLISITQWIHHCARRRRRMQMMVQSPEWHYVIPKIYLTLTSNRKKVETANNWKTSDPKWNSWAVPVRP